MRRAAPWLLLAAMLLIGVVGWQQGVTVSQVEAWLRSPAGVTLSVGLMGLAALSAFPAEAVALSNGAVHGPLWGTALTWSGAMLGAGLAYALAHRWAPPPGPMLRRIQAAADDPLALLTVRLIPLFPFFLVNYACGIARVPRWRFAWTTALGILPLSVILSGLGEQGRQDPRALLVLAALAGVSGAGAVWRSWRGRGRDTL